MLPACLMHKKQAAEGATNAQPQTGVGLRLARVDARSWQFYNSCMLTWIDPPPEPIEHSNVLIVVERAEPSIAVKTPSDAYNAFMRAKGCLGTSTRAQIDTELAQMRSEWDRPLGF